jgi:hypothetical protein
MKKYAAWVLLGVALLTLAAVDIETGGKDTHSGR